MKPETKVIDLLRQEGLADAEIPSFLLRLSHNFEHDMLEESDEPMMKEVVPGVYASDLDSVKRAFNAAKAKSFVSEVK